MFYIAINDLGKSEAILFYPGDDKCCVYSSALKLKAGECGTLEFTVPTANILYSELKEWSIVTVYRDDAEYWRGYISEISTDYLGNAEVYCVEDLAWMNYEVYSIAKGTATRQALLSSIIETYNAKSGISGTEKTFDVGAVYYGGTDEVDYEFNYDDTVLSCLRQIAGDDLLVRVRRENGKRYIDMLRLDDYATENEQYIQFGYNLLDYTKEMDTSEMLNVIYPYGAETDSEVYEGLKQRISGSEYSDATSIAKYGRIAKNIIFEDISVVDDLNTAAQEYLTKYSQPKLTLELTALDMSDLGSSTSKLDLGDKIRVIAEPYAIDQWIRITELSINLQDISKNQYTLSDEIQQNKTLTQQTISSAQKVAATAPESEILSAAKKNAVALLQGGDGGYLSFIFDESGQMNGFQITDTQDVSQATKKWIWNENGLGYMYIDQDTSHSTYGQWVTNNAMTKDGKIVADNIISGTINAADINGVNITGCSITSEVDGKSGGTYISGGGLHVKNGTSGFAEFTQVIDDSGDSAYKDEYCTVGGSRWYAHYYLPDEARWVDQSFNTRDLFSIINNLKSS